MKTRPLLTLRLTTAPIQNIGPGPHGKGLTFPIIGGSFEGDRVRGKVLPGGDDWAVERADGVIELDLRVTLETDDGALIHMTFAGLRDDGASYFRTTPRFETAKCFHTAVNQTSAGCCGGYCDIQTVGVSRKPVGQIPREMREREALQEMDYRATFGSLAKWVTEIDDPARIPELVSRAFYTAASGRPG